MTVKQLEPDHSQNGEQWLILDFFAKVGALENVPRFLDLGAFDGMSGSNTRALSDQGWRGVLVEADPRAFIRCVANHRGNDKMDCVLGAVAGGAHEFTRDAMNRNRQASMKRVRPFYDAGDQVSTAYGAHLLGGRVKGRWWTGVITPQELALTFGDRYDFVNVDVEGSDYDVVEALAPCLAWTKLVCFEDTMPCTEWEPRYWERMMALWARHGFDEVVGRTKDPRGMPANTLLTRGRRIEL